MMNRIFLFIFLFLSFNSFAAGKKRAADDNSVFWKEVQQKMPSFKKVFRRYRDYRFEIIYTRVDRNPFNKPRFTVYHFGDSLSYFYPASAVKLPVATFALEKIRQYPGAGAGSLLELDSASFCNGYSYSNRYYFFRRVEEDMSLKEFAKKSGREPETILQLNNGLRENDQLKKGTFIRMYKGKMIPSLRFLITVMLVYSDNAAYNKLFEFVQPDFINSRFRDLGYMQSRIIRRFALCSEEEHRITRGYALYDGVNESILTSENESRQSVHDELLIRGIKVGRRQSDGEVVTRGGRNFNRHNFIPLRELNQFLVELVFYEEFKKFSLHHSDWSSLMKWLGMYPSELMYTYDTTGRNQYDGVTNYLFTGKEKAEITSARIINVVGLAYGFATDCAYYFDPSSQVEFFLSCRIYTNKDNTLGNNKYEYHTIAFPLMKELGQTILKTEEQRKKEFLPTFHELRSVFGN